MGAKSSPSTALIVKLKGAGTSTLSAEQPLQVFASTLRIFEDHERRIREDLHRRAPYRLDAGRLWKPLVLFSTPATAPT
jgi:hypothetical protein